MALIKCPECGRENVSDTAKACPDCGFNISKHYGTEISLTSRNNTKTRRIIIFLSIIFAICVSISISTGLKSHNKIKSIKTQIESETKIYNREKFFATDPDNYSFKYYDEYLESEQKLEALKDDKNKQRKIEIISIICFSIFLIFFIIAPFLPCDRTKHFIE